MKKVLRGADLNFLICITDINENINSIDDFSVFEVKVYTDDENIDFQYNKDNIDLSNDILNISSVVLDKLNPGQISLCIHYGLENIFFEDGFNDFYRDIHTSYYLSDEEYNYNHSFNEKVKWGSLTGDIEDQTDLVNYIQDYISTDSVIDIIENIVNNGDTINITVDSSAIKTDILDTVKNTYIQRTEYVKNFNTINSSVNNLKREISAIDDDLGAILIQIEDNIKDILDISTRLYNFNPSTGQGGNDTSINIDLSDYYKKSEVYNKTEINKIIQNISTGDTILSEDYYTKEEIDNKNFLTTNNLQNYYNKSQIDQKFLNLDYYSKEEIDNIVQNISTNDTDLTLYYTKEEIDNKGFLTQQESLNKYYTKTYIDNFYYNKSQIVNSYYTKSQIDNKNFLTGLSLSNYYTKVDIDNKKYITEGNALTIIESLVSPAVDSVLSEQIQDGKVVINQTVKEYITNIEVLTEEAYNSLIVKEENKLYIII